jgi:hypothetical protein
MIDKGEDVEAFKLPPAASPSRVVHRRASRLARPAEPSSNVVEKARVHINSEKTRLLSSGYVFVSGDGDLGSPGSNSRGPTLLGGGSSRPALTHLLSLKSKTLENIAREANWLLQLEVPPTFSRLLETAIRANAVASSVVEREKTQGAAAQTSRVNVKPVSQAATAQMLACAVSMARASGRARALGCAVASPLATGAVDPATLWKKALPKRFAMTSTSRMPLNALPTKLTGSCIMRCARKLAAAELERFAISELVCQPTPALQAICASVVYSDGILDPVWSAFVLIVHLLGHPVGRAILKETDLTDVDFATAVTFESYGRGEVTRRARLDLANNKKDVASTSDADAKAAGVEALASAEKSQAERALATKRKRGNRASAASLGNGGDASHLAWWAHALKCPNKNVLETLVAASRSAAREAADETLKKQAGNDDAVANNIIVKRISEKNAVDSASRLVASFVGRAPDEVAGIVTWSIGDATFVGFQRMPSDARTTVLHACRKAPLHAQPRASTRMAMAWSESSTKMVPCDDNASLVLPGLLERLHRAECTARTGGKMNELRASRLRETAFGETDLPKTTLMSGATRAFISFSTRLRVHETQLALGEALGDRMRAQMTKAQREVGARGGANDTPQLHAVDRDDDARFEPLCTPASHLAVGLAVGEQLRTWLIGKTRKADPARVFLGASQASFERRRDFNATILNSEPVPLLAVTDVSISMDEEDAADAAGTCRADVALHVGATDIVRVPEVLRMLLQSDACASGALPVWLARSVLWGATCQASYLADVGTNIAAGYSNAAISCSKKISVCDTHRALLLSAFDVYASSNLGFDENFKGSAHEGFYGPGYCTGVSPAGINAQNYRSDKRQHGNVSLSQELADELCQRLAQKHHVFFREQKRVCERPVQTEGIPHAFVPGVHAHLDALAEALETLRRELGTQHENKTTSLLCLPVSAWTQAIAPGVDPNSDLSLRLCVRNPMLASSCTGCAYLPDASHDDDALLREPLFRRPSQVVAADNPYSTALEHVETFFAAASHLALLSRLCPKPESMVLDGSGSDGLDRLHACVSALLGDDAVDAATLLIAVDACLLLTVLYPCSWGVSEPVVHAWLATLAPRANAAVAAELELEEASAAVERGAPLDGGDGFAGAPPRPVHSLASLGMDAPARAAARAWWRAFSRDDPARCAWASGIAPLLRLLDAHDGSHDVDAATRGAVRGALERAVQAAWLVHSPDGVAPPPEPCPASVAASPEGVRRPLIDPVLVALEADGIDAPRGCLVGLKPFQFRQLAHLAVAPHADAAQVFRNEGGLNLRLSSAADVGLNRTSKSISPVQIESDEAAFGSRAAKLKGAKLQRSAWDLNVRALAPLFEHISPPLPATRRMRGGPCAYTDPEGRSMHAQTECEARAREHMSAAAANAVPGGGR